MFAFYYVKTQDFYHPIIVDPNDENANTDSFENSSVFFLSTFQYLVICMVFSISKPFRQPLYTNLWFTISLIVLVAFSLFITLCEDDWVISWFGLEAGITEMYRLIILVAVTVNAIMSYLFERIVVWYVSQWWKLRKDRKKAIKQHEEIAR